MLKKILSIIILIAGINSCMKSQTIKKYPYEFEYDYRHEIKNSDYNSDYFGVRSKVEFTCVPWNSGEKQLSISEKKQLSEDYFNKAFSTNSDIKEGYFLSPDGVKKRAYKISSSHAVKGENELHFIYIVIKDPNNLVQITLVNKDKKQVQSDLMFILSHIKVLDF